jgi:hypothetical protein
VVKRQKANNNCFDFSKKIHLGRRAAKKSEGQKSIFISRPALDSMGTAGFSGL